LIIGVQEQLNLGHLTWVGHDDLPHSALRRGDALLDRAQQVIEFKGLEQHGRGQLFGLIWGLMFGGQDKHRDVVERRVLLEVVTFGDGL